MPNSVRQIAPESNQTEKIRAKVSERAKALDALITEQSIKQTKEKIKEQFHRNTGERNSEVVGKPMRLYAEGVGVQLNPSPKVAAIMERLKLEFAHQMEVVRNDLSPMTIKPLESDS